MKHSKIFTVTVLFALMSFARVNAADTIGRNHSLPVELKYAGIYKNQPLIQLNFSGNKDENVFSISITDQAGIVLYLNDVKGENFSKQFLLNTDELGDAVLRFEITGKKSGTKAVYQVSRQRNISEQMDVVKL